MKELIGRLVQEADLTHEQAGKVAEVVRSFLGEKLPSPVRGIVENALTGENVDSAAGEVKSLLGKLF